MKNNSVDNNSNNRDLENNGVPYSSTTTPPPSTAVSFDFVQAILHEAEKVIANNPALQEIYIKKLEAKVVQEIIHVVEEFIHDYYVKAADVASIVLDKASEITHETLEMLIKGGALVFDATKIALKEIHEGALVLKDGLLYVMRGGKLSLEFSLFTVPAELLKNTLPQTPGDVILFWITYLGSTELFFPYAPKVAHWILQTIGTHLASFYQLGGFTAGMFKFGIEQAYGPQLATALTYGTGGLTAFSVLCAVHLLYQFLQWMRTEKSPKTDSKEPVQEMLDATENILQLLEKIRTNYGFDPTCWERTIVPEINIQMLQSWRMTANPFARAQEILERVTQREEEAKLGGRKEEEQDLAALRRSLDKFIKETDAAVKKK